MEKITKEVTIPAKKDFHLMIMGQIISILGSTLLRFALSLYILDITGRADIYAALYAISNIPLLLAPLGGAIADRFNRRNLMVLFDLTSSVIIGIYMLSMLAGSSSVVLTGSVMVLLAIISAMYTPAVTASIPLLVADEKLEGANGIIQAVQALSAVVAPVLGGILYGYMGVCPLVALSAIAFALSAAMEAFIKIPFKQQPQDAKMISTIAKDLKYGFSYVVNQPFILKSMVLAALLNVILTPYFIVGGPIVLRVTMASSDALYGIGMGLINGAAIAGALMTGIAAKKMKMSTLHRFIWLIVLLLLPMALAVTPIMLGMGFYPSYLLFILCAFPIAMVMTLISIYIMTKVQKVTPNENLGKVMAIITAAAQCAAPIGQFVYGVLFQQLSGRIYLPTLIVSLGMAGLAVLSRRLLQHEEDI